MSEQNNSTSFIIFLGTAGARFMVSRQLAASGGLWLSLEGSEILIDPGPGTIVQSTKRKLNAEKLDAIVLSHRHLDHSSDVNVMIEAMTNGGFHRHGKLFAPSDALGSEPVVFSYLKNFLDDIIVMEAGKSFKVGTVSFTTPVRLMHSVETYGMIFRTSQHTLAYMPDTGYFEGLNQIYAGSELIIFNMVLTQPRPPIDHLSIPEVMRLIKDLHPKVAILSHFGLHVWQENPWKIAEELSQQTGVKVIAARDGMKFDLAQIDKE